MPAVEGHGSSDNRCRDDPHGSLGPSATAAFAGATAARKSRLRIMRVAWSG